VGSELVDKYNIILVTPEMSAGFTNESQSTCAAYVDDLSFLYYLDPVTTPAVSQTRENFEGTQINPRYLNSWTK